MEFSRFRAEHFPETTGKVRWLDESGTRVYQLDFVMPKPPADPETFWQAGLPIYHLVERSPEEIQTTRERYLDAVARFNAKFPGREISAAGEP